MTEPLEKDNQELTEENEESPQSVKPCRDCDIPEGLDF
jgi:hypothetical protein